MAVGIGDAVVGGLIGVGGVTISALGGVWVAGQQGRIQSKASVAQRFAALEDARRLAWADMLTKGEMLSDSLREIVTFQQRSDVDRDTLELYADRWESFLAASSSVSILSTKSVNAAVFAFREPIVNMCNLVDAWLRGEKWSKKSSKEFESWVKDKNDARATLLDLIAPTK